MTTDPDPTGLPITVQSAPDTVLLEHLQLKNGKAA